MKGYFCFRKKPLLFFGVCLWMGVFVHYVCITYGISFSPLYRFYNMTFSKTHMQGTFYNPNSTKTHLQPRYSNLTGEARALAIARRMANQGNPLLITVVNKAFLPLAHSWLCNTKFMDIHDKVMFIVPEITSRMELENMWPAINVLDVTELGNGTRAVAFSTAGYLRLMIYRTNLMYKLLMNNVDVFLFEVDAVWFRNPVYDIIKRLGNNDIAVVPVTGYSDLVAGGLLYLRATNRTKVMWTELNKKMNQLGDRIQQKQAKVKIPKAEKRENDQGYLSRLIADQFANIKVAYLPGDVYADGLWYITKKKNPNPVLINNNFIIGRDKKISRAKKFKHWFWKEMTHTCDFVLVRNMSMSQDLEITLG